MTSILFTASNTVLGKTIRALTNEPVSHVAVRYGEYVMHSSVLGVTVTSYKEFSEHSNIVFEVPANISCVILLNTISKYSRSFYDYGCLFYLGVRFLAKNYLHIPMPKVNLWAASGMFTCTEFVTGIIDTTQDSLITPYGLYLRLTKGN